MARTFERQVRYTSRIDEEDDDCLHSNHTCGIPLQRPQSLNFLPRFQRKTILAGVLGIGIAFIFTYIYYWLFGGIEWTIKNDSLTEDHITVKSLSFQIRRVLWSVFLGVSFGGFTWGIIYTDSAVPGIFPPTPLSPKVVRSQSGHTFHSGYIVAILSGSCVCLYSLLRTFWCDCNSDNCLRLSF